MLRGCIAYLTALGKDNCGSGVRGDLSTDNMGSELNGQITGTRLKNARGRGLPHIIHDPSVWQVLSIGQLTC